MSLATLQPSGQGIIRHDITGRAEIIIQPRAGAIFQPGSAVAHRIGTQLAEIPLAATPRSDLVPLGRFLGDSAFTASSTADAFGGAIDANGNPQSITVMPFSASGTGWFATGTGINQVTATNLDAPVFFFDDDTVYLTNNFGTLSFAGFMTAVDPATGRVAFKSDAQTRCLYELYSTGESAPGATQDLTARLVATNLNTTVTGAGTGVLTGSTNAALANQDGVAPAVGDTIVVPTGTIGSGVVAAADSGPYKITQLGSASLPFILTRDPRWAHAAGITPGSQIRLGSEGTLFRDTRWYAAPLTATKKVGTDDPRLAPEKVMTQVTLVAGTVTISAIPIRDAARVSVDPTLAGGTPAGTTTCFDLKQTAGIVAGGIGTASLVLEAHSTKGVKVATDVSIIDLSILQ